MGRRSGVIVWFTGVPGAGKSTLARSLEHAAREVRPVAVLDGDEIREFLSKDLGFSKDDRDTNVRRIGFVARIVARTGSMAICAVVSPYSQARLELRELAMRESIDFVEVHVHAPLEVLIARDPKGHYAKALAGKLSDFTGVSAPYEPPEQPELSLDTSLRDADACVRELIAKLEARGHLP